MNGGLRQLGALLCVVLGMVSCSDNETPSRPTPVTNPTPNPAPTQTPSNRAPRADDVSISSDLSTPYIAVQLSGEDPDGDAIIYVLDGEESGPGYENAHIDSETGLMYVTLDSDALNDSDQVRIGYRTTDGSLSSDIASVSISIGASESGGLGYQQADEDDYSQFGLRVFDSGRFETTEIPKAIDLSPFFPPPGDQGTQGSCVGWAVGYALKSYQERMEEGWSWNPATIFSPSWIYNQINNGTDDGAYIYDGLELIVAKGAASLLTMPYRQADYRSQPPQRARAEATRFRARDFSRVSGERDMKLALANGYPIVIGFDVYESFKDLSGRASVYNSKQGGQDGGHAMTIVGYDDARFGGSFRAINSWGTRWGDGGYVWLPYDFAGQVIWEAYIVTDAGNEGGGQPPSDTASQGQPNALPDLQVDEWFIEYNNHPGGTGSWDWSIINTGPGVAAGGMDVSLVLSRDETIDSDDLVIVYQEVSFDLPTGHVASASGTGFVFPPDLEPGTYHIAVWVDDLDEVTESNEDNNIQLGRRTIAIEGADLADLSVVDWSAQWDDADGAGTLSYTIINDGTRPAKPTDPKDLGWDVTLILHQLRRPSRVTERGQGVYFLYWKTQTSPLFPGDTVRENDEEFNLYEDVWDYGEPIAIPPGVYYMSLWVDDFNEVLESDDSNNISPWPSGIVTVPSRPGDDAADGHSPMGNSALHSAFNGRRLPREMATKGVEIVDLGNGEREFRFFTVDERDLEERPIPYPKVNRGAGSVIFPRADVKTITAN